MPLPSKSKERLAVSLVDLDRVPSGIRTKMLAGRLDLSKILQVGEDLIYKIPAVAFNCPLLEAAIICDTLRSHDRRMGDYPTTVYIYRQTTWSRVTNSTVLTLTDEDNRCYLNPEVFDTEVKFAEPIPLEPERII